MILLIDNYDSFVQNLARYLRRLGHATRVVRNDCIDGQQVREMNPQAIVFSPGPCTPLEAGISQTLVRQELGRTPMLGVCLGHQSIVAALGGRISAAREPMHGRASAISHDGRGVFAGLPNPTTVGRYHSLVAEEEELPPELLVSARTDDGTVMAVRHCEYAVVGLQFHPESVLTTHGMEMLAGFLRIAGLSVPQELPAGEARAPRGPRSDADLAGLPIVPICY